jgi:hypothetical protein
LVIGLYLAMVVAVAAYDPQRISRMNCSTIIQTTAPSRAAQARAPGA